VLTTEVKPLAPDDALDQVLVEELVGVINAAYAVGEAGFWREGWTRTNPGEIADAIRSGGMLATAVDGRIVGCAYVRPVDTNTADLGLVSVAPDRWGGGIGRELVAAAEALTRSRGTSTMQLELLFPVGWTHPEKAKLRSWYTRLGYEEIRAAPVEEVAAHLAPQLAAPAEFLVFRKRLG
jgi:GNAT superfamily N-acetyltransferase